MAIWHFLNFYTAPVLGIELLHKVETSIFERKCEFAKTEKSADFMASSITFHDSSSFFIVREGWMEV